MAAPAPSSPAPPKPPKPPPLPPPRAVPSPSPAPSIGSPSSSNQIVLPDDVDQTPLPSREATRPLSSNLESPSPNPSSRRSAPRISTASAIAATKDIKKRWCGAHDAAANGDLMRLKAYIDASDGSPKRNVYDESEFGSNPIIAASARGHVPAVVFLLSSGGAANQADLEKRTALHHAVIGRHFEVVQVLLSYKSRVDSQDVLGNTALHYAAENGDEDTIDLLLSVGCETALENKQGKTPLQIFPEYPWEEAIARGASDPPPVTASNVAASEVTSFSVRVTWESEPHAAGESVMFEAVAIMQTCEIPEFKRALEQQRQLQVEQAHSVKALRVLKAGLKDFIKSADKMDRDFDEKIAASKKDVAYKQELVRLKAANAAAVAQRKAEANEQAAQLQAIISSQPPGITNGVVLPPSSHQFWDSKVFQTGETSVHMQGLVPGSTYHVHVRSRWLFAEEDQYEGLPVEWGPFSAVPCVVQTPPAPPDAPQQLRVGLRTPTSVQLHWMPPKCCNGDDVNSYEVQYQFDVFGPRYSKIVPPVPENYSVSGLARSSWVFNIRVRAKNCSGWSCWSSIISKVASFSDIPAPIDPSSIRCQPGVGCINLEWPEPDCRGRAIDQYRVTCVVVPSGCVPVAADNPAAITRRQYELHAKARVAGLHGGDAVFLAISAHNEAGNANDSAAAPPLFCLPSAPPPPINITVKAVTANSVVLGWDAPSHNHGSVITHYRISQIMSNGAHKSVDIPSTRSAFDFSGLKPGDFVRSAQVQSGNIAGFGAASERFVLRTLAMPSSPPLHLRLVRAIANGSNCSATIAWNAPSFNNGAPINAYALVFQRLKRDVTRIVMALPPALVLPDTETPHQFGRLLEYSGPHGAKPAADEAEPEALVGSAVLPGGNGGNGLSVSLISTLHEGEKTSFQVTISGFVEGEWITNCFCKARSSAGWSSPCAEALEVRIPGTALLYENQGKDDV